MSSTTEALRAFVAALPDQDEHGRVLVQVATALALEIDVAQMPNDKGQTKAAAAAVRELRAVMDELLSKGRTDDDDDWTAAPGATAVRHGT